MKLGISFFFVLHFVAYCVVAVESAGRQIPIAFLERVKEEFSKKYGGGKAATASARSLNKEYGYLIFLIEILMINAFLLTIFFKQT